MRIYVINLARRPDRLAFMHQQLTALGLPFERVEATDAAAPDFVHDAPLITRSEQACALSHRRTWQQFLDTGNAQCLILEDDAVLGRDLPAFLTHKRAFPAGVDLLRLEVWHPRSLLGRGHRSGRGGYRSHRLHSVDFGLAAYMISRDFAARAVREIVTFRAPVDDTLFDPHATGYCPSVVHQLRPALAIQAHRHVSTEGTAASASDIRTDRHARLGIGPDAHRPRQKRRRSLAQRLTPPLAKWTRNTKAFLENLSRGQMWRTIPFAGAPADAAVPALEQNRTEAPEWGLNASSPAAPTATKRPG